MLSLYSDMTGLASFIGSSEFIKYMTSSARRNISGTELKML